MKAVGIAQAQAATPWEAAQTLATVFPVAGTYEVRGATGAREVTFDAPVAQAADPLSIFKAVFPADGPYFVKATAAPEREFDRWYFQQLLLQAEQGFLKLADFNRQLLAEFIGRHGGTLVDPGLIEQFERLMFDFRLAMRWSIAQPISPAARAALVARGYSERDILDWPGLAYRWGLIERELGAAADVPFETLIAMAGKAPVLHSDLVAIEYARASAGQYLTPMVGRDGAVFTEALVREQAMLRTMVPAAIEQEINARTFSRELFKVLSPEGVSRDFRRVARTEIQEARLRGAFEGERRAQGWTPETRIYRTLSAHPCSACLTLYVSPGGTPRLYTVAAVEAADALGVNRGPWQSWHVRKGPTHPNCLDSPWLAYTPAHEVAFARDRDAWRAEYTRHKLDRAKE